MRRMSVAAGEQKFASYSQAVFNLARTRRLRAARGPAGYSPSAKVSVVGAGAGRILARADQWRLSAFGCQNASCTRRSHLTPP